MQIRNKLYLERYVIGTVLNFVWTPYVFGFQNISLVLAFLLSILLNQYFLAIVVADLTGVEENHSCLPTWLCAALKLIVLMLGFYWTLENTEDLEVFVVLFYKIQLIILVLSIKRVVKKN
jgi:hypothetical protein